MFKSLPTLLLLAFTTSIFSQEIVNTIPLALNSSRDVFQVVDEKTEETALFLSDTKRVTAIRLNEKMEVIDTLQSSRPAVQYTSMIGYNRSADNVRLFWSSDDHEEISCELYDFKNNKVTSTKHAIKFKDERYLGNFTSNGNFYIFALQKRSNILKFYRFNNEGRLDEKTIDLGALRFFNSQYARSTLHGVLAENVGLDLPFSLQKITPEYPSSLTDCAKKRKYYVNGDQFILTFDSNVAYTQMISINLESGTSYEKFFNKPYMTFTDPDELNTNSFMINDRLFQFKSSYEKLIFTVKDLQDTILSTYEVNAEDQIAFKNSAIIQENGDYGDQRILDKTSQFMRKFNNMHSAVSAYDFGDSYLITLGSISQQSNGNAVMYGAMFGVAGVLVAAAISNPVYNSFTAYSNRKVVYINSILDKNGKHIPGEVKSFAFDNVRKFLDENKKTSSETLFKLSTSYYLGYYDTKSKSYVLRKFAE